MQRILKVESLNLQSKNDEMQKLIMLNYENLLNGLQSKIQIMCKSEEYNINDYKIHDAKLYNYIKSYSEKYSCVNKTFFIIVSDSNKARLDSNMSTIMRSLKNMNIYYEEVLENSSYQWDKVVEMNRKYIKDDKYYYKTVYVSDWPYYCTPGWLEFLYNSDLNIDINCYINPQDTIKSIKFLRKKLVQFGVSADFECERTNDEDMFSSELEGISLMLDELRSNLGKLLFVSYYITIKGKTNDALQQNYLNVKNWLNSRNIIVNDCFLFQHKAYRNNMLNCKDEIGKDYNFTTSSLKCFFPFQSLNICDKKGIYIGVNQQNKNLIFLDIFTRQYAVMLILGIMGSGKSFLAKNIIQNLADNGVEITILDKSREYSIFNNDNIKVHSNKTMKEYVQIVKEYITKINSDYERGVLKQRLFVVDELWSYIDADNEYAEQFNQLFSEIILEGRKKYLASLFMSQLIESLINNKAGQTIIKTANIKFLMQMEYNAAKLLATEFNLSQQQMNFLSVAQHEGIMTVNSNCIQFKVETTDERKKLFNTTPLMEVNI